MGENGAAGAVRSAGYRRYWIGLLLMLLITVGYVDRITISVAGPALAKAYSLSPLTLGLLFSAFFWGYAAMMVPGGWLIDRFSKARVLPCAVLIWTVISMLTGTLGSLGALFVARILLGMSEAPGYPSGNLIIREWAPLRERGVFTALMQAGSLFGPAVATAPAAYIVTHYGWRLSFVILGASGLLWLVAWLLLYRKPEKARWISEGERRDILVSRDVAGPSVAANKVVMSLPQLLRQWPLIGILAANGTQTYAIYFLITWLPSYLVNSKHRFDLMHSGVLLSVAFLFAMILSIGLGLMSDRWLSLSRPRAERGARRHPVAMLMLLGLIGLWLIPFCPGTAALVIVIALTLSVLTTSIVLTFALTNDLIVDEGAAGRTFGLVSFGGQIIGLLAPVVTGWLVALSGYGLVFAATALLVLLGTLAIWTLPTSPMRPRVQGAEPERTRAL